MVLGLNANWRMSMFWQAGAANYLYITVFILLFVWCYLREVPDEGSFLPGFGKWRKGESRSVLTGGGAVGKDSGARDGLCRGGVHRSAGDVFLRRISGVALGVDPVKRHLEKRENGALCPAAYSGGIPCDHASQC